MSHQTQLLSSTAKLQPFKTNSCPSENMKDHYGHFEIRDKSNDSYGADSQKILLLHYHSIGAKDQHSYELTCKLRDKNSSIVELVDLEHHTVTKYKLQIALNSLTLSMANFHLLDHKELKLHLLHLSPEIAHSFRVENLPPMQYKPTDPHVTSYIESVIAAKAVLSRINLQMSLVDADGHGQLVNQLPTIFAESPELVKAIEAASPQNERSMLQAMIESEEELSFIVKEVFSKTGVTQCPFCSLGKRKYTTETESNKKAKLDIATYSASSMNSPESGAANNDYQLVSVEEKMLENIRENSGINDRQCETLKLGYFKLGDGKHVSGFDIRIKGIIYCKRELGIGGNGRNYSFYAFRIFLENQDLQKSYFSIVTEMANLPDLSIDGNELKNDHIEVCEDNKMFKNTALNYSSVSSHKFFDHLLTPFQMELVQEKSEHSNQSLFEALASGLNIEQQDNKTSWELFSNFDTTKTNAPFLKKIACICNQKQINIEVYGLCRNDVPILFHFNKKGECQPYLGISAIKEFHELIAEGTMMLMTSIYLPKIDGNIAEQLPKLESYLSEDNSNWFVIKPSQENNRTFDKSTVTSVKLTTDDCVIS